MFTPGTKIKKLIIINQLDKRDIYGNRLWNCQCECGEFREICTAELTKLNNRPSSNKLCLCSSVRTRNNFLRRDLIEYKAWCGMIQRCTNPKETQYRNYGDRGIKICDSWRNSFENFYKDMGSKPGKEYSLDRIDVNGDYTPENCRWATRDQQQANKTNSIKVEINNEIKTIGEWAKLNNLKFGTVYNRFRRGLTGINLISPISPRFEVSIGNITKSLVEVAKETNYNYCTLRYRLSVGKSEEELFLPSKRSWKTSISNKVKFRKESRCWKSMIARCCNTTHGSYRNYGGRGITVCQEWIDSFDKFLEDVGLAPSSKHSLDRIDNNKGYYKENCRWATSDVQSANRRPTHHIEINGEVYTIRELSEKYNIKHATIYGRYKRGITGLDLVK